MLCYDVRGNGDLIKCTIILFIDMMYACTCMHMMAQEKVIDVWLLAGRKHDKTRKCVYYTEHIPRKTLNIVAIINMTF